MRPQVFAAMVIGLTVAAVGLLLLGRPHSGEQIQRPEIPPEHRQVRVTGEAVVPVPADMARVRAGFSVRAATTEDLDERYRERVADLAGALAAAGVRPDDVEIGSRRLYTGEDFLSPGHTLWRNRDFEAHITVRDLGRLDEVLSSAWAAGAAEVRVELFGVQDPEPYRQAALRQAMLNAQERAQALASAGGLRLRGTIAAAVELEQPSADSQIPGPTAKAPGGLWVRAVATVTYEHRP